MVYPYNRIIFSNKKVYHKSVILNESQTQTQILYGYVYMKFTGKRNPKRQKAVNDFLGLEGEQKLNANEHSSDLCLCLHMHAPVCVVSYFLLLQ